MKYESFIRMTDMYNEYDFVFFGDDGQGDLYAGQKMIDFLDRDRLLQKTRGHEQTMIKKSISKVQSAVGTPSVQHLHEEVRDALGPSCPQMSQMLCVLIHNVYSKQEKFMCCKCERDYLSKWEQDSEDESEDEDETVTLTQAKSKNKLRRYDTYIGAAGELLRKGVISRQDLEKVTKSAMGDIRAVRQDLNKVGDEKKRRKGLDNLNEVERFYKADCERLNLHQHWQTYESWKLEDDKRRGEMLEELEESEESASEDALLIRVTSP